MVCIIDLSLIVFEILGIIKGARGYFQCATTNSYCRLLLFSLSLIVSLNCKLTLKPLSFILLAGAPVANPPQVKVKTPYYIFILYDGHFCGITFYPNRLWNSTGRSFWSESHEACGARFWQGIRNTSAQAVQREWGASCCILVWWLDSRGFFLAFCLLNPFQGWILIWKWLKN